MKAANHRMAGAQAAQIVKVRLRHVSAATRRRRVAVARIVAETIWRRWHRNVDGWQLKHVIWYLRHATKAHAPNTKYQHWLCLRFLIAETGRGHWLRSLKGDWLTPTGSSVENRRV